MITFFFFFFPATGIWLCVLYFWSLNVSTKSTSLLYIMFKFLMMKGPYVVCLGLSGTNCIRERYHTLGMWCFMCDVSTFYRTSLFLAPRRCIIAFLEVPPLQMFLFTAVSVWRRLIVCQLGSSASLCLWEWAQSGKHLVPHQAACRG